MVGRIFIWKLIVDMLCVEIVQGYYCVGDKLLIEVEMLWWFGVNCYMVWYVLIVLFEDGIVMLWCGVGVFVIMD